MKDWQFFILVGIGLAIIADLDHLRGRLIWSIVDNLLSVIFFATAVVYLVKS